MQDLDDLYFRQIALGPMENFIYFLGSKKTKTCLVVDPAWSTETLLQIAAEDDMTINGALVTHYHPDHVGGEMMGFTVPGGVADLLEHVDGKIHVNKHEAEGLKKITGISDTDLVRHDSSDKVQIGDVEIELIHTPGHTPGSQCFKVRDRLVSGDTLFINGCGRVDLPGADPEAMYHSLTGTLAKLPDNIVLYPGHNYGGAPSANLGEQKQTNHYLRVRSLADWMQMMG